MLQAIDEWIKLNIGVDWLPGVFYSASSFPSPNAKMALTYPAVGMREGVS
jgi:hypothetical protein